MASLTDEEFESALVEDLGWRRIELAALKRALDEAAKRSADGPATRGLSRAMVAMCYAHWEGYSKNALELYSRLVTRRRPRLTEASDGLVLEHVHRLIKRVKSGDEYAKTALTDAVRGQSDERLNIDRALLADTKSNLRYATLRDLFNRGCIPLDNFELKANLIDVLLCDRRNSVAHGRALFIPPDESIVLCDEVLLLMEAMRDVLVTHVRSKGYLTTSQTTTSTATTAKETDSPDA